MPDETRTPQKDQPEGSREVIDRELKRQDAKENKESGRNRDTEAPRRE
jgi:hypothetical protein